MIPKIHIALSRAKGMTEGTLEFSFDADPDWLDIPFVGFSSPVAAQLRYEIAEDDSVEVFGSVAFTIAGSCSRCLSPAEERIVQEVRAVFVEGEADEGAGEFPYANGSVDLSEWMRECVIFALPPVLHCASCKRQDI